MCGLFHAHRKIIRHYLLPIIRHWLTFALPPTSTTAEINESHRSLKTNRYTASAGKGFDASRVGDSHVDAPYRPR